MRNKVKQSGGGKPPDARKNARRTATGILSILIAAAIAVVAAWQAAGLAFHLVFSRFDNHDSAAPLLLAAPAAFAVFLLAFTGALLLMMGVPHAIWRAGSGQSLDRRDREKPNQ